MISPHTKENGNCMTMVEVLANAMVVISLQYINVSNHINVSNVSLYKF